MECEFRRQKRGSLFLNAMHFDSGFCTNPAWANPSVVERVFSSNADVRIDDDE